MGMRSRASADADRPSKPDGPQLGEWAMSPSLRKASVWRVRRVAGPMANTRLVGAGALWHWPMPRMWQRFQRVASCRHAPTINAKPRLGTRTKGLLCSEVFSQTQIVKAWLKEDCPPYGSHIRQTG